MNDRQLSWNVNERPVSSAANSHAPSLAFDLCMMMSLPLWKRSPRSLFFSLYLHSKKSRFGFFSLPRSVYFCYFSLFLFVGNGFLLHSSCASFFLNCIHLKFVSFVFLLLPVSSSSRFIGLFYVPNTLSFSCEVTFTVILVSPNYLVFLFSCTLFPSFVLHVIIFVWVHRGVMIFCSSSMKICCFKSIFRVSSVVFSYVSLSICIMLWVTTLLMHFLISTPLFLLHWKQQARLFMTLRHLSPVAHLLSSKNRSACFLSFSFSHFPFWEGTARWRRRRWE